MRKPIQIILSLFLLLATGLSACTSTQADPTQALSTETPTSIPATPTATQTPPRSLVICLGYEPQSLYVYASNSAAMWSVLEAVYDGPFDSQNYTAQPVILESVPSLDDGSIVITSVDVIPGDEVVDINGNLVTLAEGVEVYTSGCTTEGCATTSDGLTTVQMDQMTITFKMRSDIKWSDGSPLIASDSVYSYQLDADSSTTSSKYAVERTVSYTASDDYTITWVGKPGFIDANPTNRFWLPLPEHVWGTMSATDLLTSDLSNRNPLGWGPYQISEWVEGDHITLTKNANYFRAAEGLPKFDTLVYRFLSDNSAANLSALEAGECDIMDQSTYLDEDIESLLQLQESGKVNAYFASSSEWEHLDFGIKPASYDDFYSAWGGDRADFFSDTRTRQAFTYCLDRATVNDKLFIDRSEIPTSYVPTNHPLYSSDAASYSYDPAKGQELLDEVGWKDTDNDSSTPRVSQGIANLPDDTVLSVNYWTTEATLRTQSSEILANSLRGCGIQVNVQTYSPADLFAAGPTGPVFGRAFDLVQFTWENSLQSACELYLSSKIPNADNQWIGANVSGYASQEFDDACRTSLQSAPGSQEQIDSSALAQQIFAADIPSVPLYTIVKVAATRSDLCGFSMDTSGKSTLSNLESYDYGSGCSN